MIHVGVRFPVSVGPTSISLAKRLRWYLAKGVVDGVADPAATRSRLSGVVGVDGVADNAAAAVAALRTVWRVPAAGPPAGVTVRLGTAKACGVGQVVYRRLPG